MPKRIFWETLVKKYENYKLLHVLLFVNLFAMDTSLILKRHLFNFSLPHPATNCYVYPACA